MSIEEQASKIREEGKNVNLYETVEMIRDLLYRLQNGVRQQKQGVGIDTFLIAQVILATHTQLDVIESVLNPHCSRCDE